jgi:predicted nucleic acid-binding protein
MLGAWKEILPVESVRECALEQLGRFPLRAADALQLAAAIIWSGRNPRGRRFVSNDLQLGSAAREAGFDVLTT